MRSICDSSAPQRKEIVSVGPLTIKDSNTWLRESSMLPTPTYLWKELFIENELCCLFADTNVGKSILAVQIASDIASTGRNVLYFDFELSQKQFEARYSCDNELHTFPAGLLRCEMNMQDYHDYDVEESIIPLISVAAEANDCNVIIIDNLTWLVSSAEKGESAAKLMKGLLGLKKEHGYSVLVLAHTPKRPAGMPISQNDLAGSKQLMNFFDSAFAIGRSGKEENLRYIKQIKARTTGILYGSENVIICELEKRDRFLRFTEITTEPESRHLITPEESEKQKLKADIRQLHEEGKSEREIAALLGICKTTVHRSLRA